jgi:hypothetical protein
MAPSTNQQINKSTNQQVNKSTSQQVNKSTSQQINCKARPRCAFAECKDFKYKKPPHCSGFSGRQHG